MPIDVSVVVPFFNPGANLDDCLASLSAQTLAAERFEVVLVDDGSTDGSDRRAERWVAAHDGPATLRRIPASGGPARPRNIGIDTAAGRYIQFLDSDDMLAPRALERQLEIADDSDADVVVGKLASDFRGIWHPLFRRTVTGRTLADYPLIQNVTVCKMFRRALLAEHGIRFPEGPHYIEDQQICVQSYAHARSVAVVADMVCYFYRRRRTAGRNYGDTAIVPAAYFRELEAIFDVVDTEVTAAAARLSCFSRYYRGEMLGRLRGKAMLQYDSAYRRTMLDEVRRVGAARIPEAVYDGLPAFLRTQSRLVSDDDVDGLTAFAAELDTMRLSATIDPPQWRDGRLVVALDAYLRHGDEPLRLERDGERWLLPASIAPTVPAAARAVGPLEDEDVDIDLATVSRADAQLWSTTEGLALSIDDDGCPRVRGEVALDPSTVMGGGALSPGLWDLRLRVMFGGLTRTSPLRPPSPDPADAATWITGAAGGMQSVRPYWTNGSPTLALDVDEWMHPLHDALDGALPEATAPGSRRRIQLPVPRALGRSGQRRAVRLTMIPVEQAATSVECDAELQLGPGGATLVARLPRLPIRDAPWQVWLRAGPLGGTPPKRLPLTLQMSRLGRVTVSPDDQD